jgi:hypothetical protein
MPRYDYATSECDDLELGMETCECGSACCRKVLKGADYLLPDLIEKYGSHFQPYLIRRQQARGLNLGARPLGEKPSTSDATHLS